MMIMKSDGFACRTTSCNKKRRNHRASLGPEILRPWLGSRHAELPRNSDITFLLLLHDCPLYDEHSCQGFITFRPNVSKVEVERHESQLAATKLTVHSAASAGVHFISARRTDVKEGIPTPKAHGTCCWTAPDHLPGLHMNLRALKASLANLLEHKSDDSNAACALKRQELQPSTLASGYYIKKLIITCHHASDPELIKSRRNWPFLDLAAVERLRIKYGRGSLLTDLFATKDWRISRFYLQWLLRS